MADCFVVRRGGGGVKPQLIVSAPAGSVIVANNGKKTVTGMVGAEGTLTLDLPSFGTWTVTATLDGQEASTSVYIEQEYPVSLSYITTFTVNGGHNETVTIYNDGEVFGSVTLDSTGTGTVELSGSAGKTLVFTGGTSGYEKPVSVGIEDAYTVDVYPDNALFWYGRQFEEKTGGWQGRGWKDSHELHVAIAPSITTNEDGSVTLKWTTDGYSGYPFGGVYETKMDIDLSAFDTVETEIKYNSSFTKSNPNVRFAIMNRTANFMSTGIVAAKSTNQNGEHTLMIPLSINDSHAIAFTMYVNSADEVHGKGTVQITLKSVRAYKSEV